VATWHRNDENTYSVGSIKKTGKQLFSVSVLQADTTEHSGKSKSKRNKGNTFCMEKEPAGEKQTDLSAGGVVTVQLAMLHCQ
jgi:hypothetical protein